MTNDDGASCRVLRRALSVCAGRPPMYKGGRAGSEPRIQSVGRLGCAEEHTIHAMAGNWGSDRATSARAACQAGPARVDASSDCAAAARDNFEFQISRPHLFPLSTTHYHNIHSHIHMVYTGGSYKQQCVSRSLECGAFLATLGRLCITHMHAFIPALSKRQPHTDNTDAMVRGFWAVAALAAACSLFMVTTYPNVQLSHTPHPTPPHVSEKDNSRSTKFPLPSSFSRAARQCGSAGHQHHPPLPYDRREWRVIDQAQACPPRPDG